MAKKNINKIPKDILKKIASIKGSEVVVGCAVKFKAEDIASGRLKNLGITLNDDGLKFPASIVP